MRRALWPLVTAAFGVLLAGLWIAAVVIFPVNATGAAADCAEGSLRIVGSTAFAPIMTDVAEEYSAACGVEIPVVADSSEEGVREVARIGPGEQSSIAALSLRQSVFPGAPESVCAQIMATMVGMEPAADDVALVTVRRSGRASSSSRGVPGSSGGA